MNNYEFSMESILELRERTEKEEMEAMGRIQHRLDLYRQEEARLEEEKKESQEAKMLCRDFEQVRYYDLYLGRINRELVEKEEEIKGAEEELETQRDRLLEAQKDRKIMEKLKEKEYENYIEEVQRQEQIELDEIAVLKFKPPESLD